MRTRQHDDVLIIGGGHNGLVCAAYLAGVPGAAAIFCLLSFIFLSNGRAFGSTDLTNHLTNAVNNISQISSVLFRDLLLPFEVTSVLILVAILGAVVLARKEQ